MRDEIQADQAVSIEAKGFAKPITAHAVRVQTDEITSSVSSVFERELQAIRLLIDKDAMPMKDRAAAASGLRELADRLAVRRA